VGKAEGSVGGKTRVALGGGLARALEQLAPLLEGHRGRCVVIGGIAVIARGVPRVTRDVDVAFAGADLPIGVLAAELASVGIVPRMQDALSFAAESQVLLARHAETGVEIDVSFAWLPFELEAMAAAGLVRVGSIMLRVAQPEDLVIYKAIAWRPQDQQDIERLLALHGQRMNLARIRRHVRELGEAMEQDRLRELDAMIGRVLPR
jgi:hypothetical protein